LSTAPLYRTGIDPQWVDYNGHLRDAYYWLIISLACDALMDRLGLDDAYRERTRCTLFTVEAHIHYLQEVKRTDLAEVQVHILGADAKRLHAGFELRTARHAGPAAVAEMMLLHVHQGEARAAASEGSATPGPAPRTVPFPAAVLEAIARYRQESAGTAMPEPGSRRMELRARS
jgi:betainyl-CoA thioesterase